MSYTFEKVTPNHRDAILEVFNYYVRNDFAAYPTVPADHEFFDRFYGSIDRYPFVAIRNDGGPIVGFACLHPYHSADSFDKTAEICYFILPDHTGRGLATQILAMFIEEAKARGISILLASISSRNVGSINFHRKHGFRQVGHMEHIGRKFDKDFGVIWMQLDLDK